jgi:hypothetical protein
MGKNEVRRGAVSDRVQNTIKRIRQDRGLTGAQLAARLGALGRPMLGTAVNKIETGARRVDVDDLVAFALALNTTPNRLLFNEPADPKGEIELTSNVTAAGFQAWAWANGEQTLIPALEPLGRAEETYGQLQDEFLRHARPPANHRALEAIDDLRSAAVAFMAGVDEYARAQQQQDERGEAGSVVPLDRLVLSAENVRRHLKQAEEGIALLLDDSPLADQSGYGTAFFASHEVHTLTRQRVIATRIQHDEARARFHQVEIEAEAAAHALAVLDERPGSAADDDGDLERRRSDQRAMLEVARTHAFHARAAAQDAHEASTRAERELYELRRMMLIRNMVPPRLPADLAYIDSLRPDHSLVEKLEELWAKVAHSRMLGWMAKRA